jgi:type I restriction enzyme M protein
VSRVEIARAAGVEPQAVSNWARRHRGSFPAASYTGGRELYPAAAVAAWLDRRRIPRDRLQDGELHGATYGQRFRRSHALLPPAAAGSGVRLGAAQTEAVLDEGLWQPLLRRWGASGVGSNLELVLFLLYLRGSDVERWAVLAAATGDGVGELLDRAGRADASRSAELSGVLASVARGPWSDRELAQIVRLVDLAVLGASRHGLTVEEFGPLACRFLLDRVASARGGRAAEYFTPPGVARVMVELADPQPGDRICDPCCGSGELLVAAGAFARGPGRAVSGPPLRGRALSGRSRRLAALHAAIHRLPVDLDEYPGDTLRLEQAPEPRCDVVLTNPPFNMPEWSDGDPALRAGWRYGPPPKHNANFAWLQYAVSMLDDGGRAVLVMPNSASTTDNARERKIRKAMVKDGVVRCVVALPARLFRETAVPVSIWVLGKPTRGGRGDVLFIDAGAAGTIVNRGYRVLDEDDCARIAGVYREWMCGRPGASGAVSGFAAVATIEQIRARGHHLNPDAHLAADPRATDSGATAAVLRDLHHELLWLRERAAAADAAVEYHLERIDAWTR